MRVSRRGNSLEVRLPAVTLARDTRRADAPARMRAREVWLPDDGRFDCDAAHDRAVDVPEAESRR